MSEKTTKKTKAHKTKDKNVEVLEGTGGKGIQLNGVTKKDAIEWIQRSLQEDERDVALHTVIPGEPLDGAVALHRAIADIHGWTDMVPTPGFFGSRPPHMIGVKVSPTETVQIPWGNIQIPGVAGTLGMSLQWDPTPAFILSGQVKHKSMPAVKELIAKTQEMLKLHSIYKGKAIRISFQWMRDGSGYNVLNHCPKFWEAEGIREDDLILPERVQLALELGLFAPIEDADFARVHKIPLKRGVLLAGPYGVGKTLVSAVTAIKAQRAGWTFGYLDDCREARDVKRALQYMVQYAPAVVFVEDIDRFVSGERTDAMNDVLNTIDGVDTKGKELILVATTNHYNLINEAFRRDGRIDSTVYIPAPDADAAARLVQKYGRDLLGPDVDLESVGKELAGHIPAFIRGVTEMSKMVARARLRKQGHTGTELGGEVTQADLDMAVQMKKDEAAFKEGETRKKSALPGRILVELPDSFDRHEQLSGLLGHNGDSE
jgi:transitional endoplasmic reticulum ATPase